MVVLLLLFIFSGMFKVGPSEKAVRLHFGKPVGEGSKALLGPGLYWAWPYPIDEIHRIPYSQLMQVKSSVGWYNTTQEKEDLDREDPAGPSLNPAVDSYAITGDGNIIHTRATLVYRIEEPVKYEFDFNNASNTVQNALDNALLYAAARFKVDDVLTKEITLFQETVKNRVTELVQNQNLGIVIDQCQVRSIAPRYLAPAFDAVLTALSTRDKVRNEALSYQNQVLSKAEAESTNRINSARVERERLVKSVQAEAERFTKMLPQYRANPELFVNVLLVEKIGQVLTNVQDKIYLPERADGKSRELRLQLSREPLSKNNATQQ